MIQFKLRRKERKKTKNNFDYHLQENIPKRYVFCYTKQAMNSTKKVFFSVIFLCLTLLVPVSGVVFAQTAEQAAQRKQLEAELAQIEAEIKKQEAELAKQKGQTGSIKKDIDVLSAEIAKKKLDIQKKNKILGNLEKEIGTKNSTLVSLTQELTREKRSLARLISEQSRLEDYSLVEILLAGDTISQFFKDIDNFYSIKSGLSDSFTKIKTIQTKTTLEKTQLEQKKINEADVKYALEQDKKNVETKQGEKKGLLVASQTKEKSYEQIIKERKAAAAAIRSKLFTLAGNVPSGGIPFGQAYDYAKAASKLTGVRAALILGILRQESGGRVDSFGHNVGQCLLVDTKTGTGKGRTSGKTIERVMKPDRDVVPFLRITKQVGRDPYNTPVSCPFTYGFGGAMGISQFIPSTWALYESRLNSMYGAADPWNPQHAITATALLMKDNGAGAQTYTAERNAACKYYSGKACGGGINEFYGNGVMKKAEEIQAQIDVLESAN